jgi:mRNA interferase YafQ
VIYKLALTSRFNNDLKKILKRGYDLQELHRVINLLQADITLPNKYRDHALGGNWNGHRECHVRPDWLLIYKVENNVLVLTLVRTGTHSDLL